MNMITVEGINYYKHVFRYSGLVLILLFIEQSEVLLVFRCLGGTGGNRYSTTFPQIRRVRVSPTNVYVTSRSALLVSFARLPADGSGHDRGLTRSIAHDVSIHSCHTQQPLHQRAFPSTAHTSALVQRRRGIQPCRIIQSLAPSTLAILIKSRGLSVAKARKR